MKFKSVVLGAKDYCKDRWHDWLLARLWKFYKRPLYYDLDSSKNGCFMPIVDWQEGSLKHYIRQRQIAAEVVKKNALTLWNIDEYLKTPKEMFEFLEAAVEEGDTEYAIIAAFDVVRCAKKIGLDYSKGKRCKRGNTKQRKKGKQSGGVCKRV